MKITVEHDGLKSEADVDMAGFSALGLSDSQIEIEAGRMCAEHVEVLLRSLQQRAAA